MTFHCKDLVASHDGQVRLVYNSELLYSQEPCVIVRRWFVWAPGFGDGEPPYEFDVIVTVEEYNKHWAPKGKAA